jgi:uncharacterized membrane protein
MVWAKREYNRRKEEEAQEKRKEDIRIVYDEMFGGLNINGEPAA